MKKLSIFVLFLMLLGFIACTEKKEADTTPPVIELKGAEQVYVNLDSAYVEPGYTATDDVDGDITSEVVVSGTVDVHTEGIYYLYYDVTDKAGNQAEQKSRKVKVLRF